MYYEWYIDLFFLENVIMDGILLILVGIAMNLRHSALRLLLAAVEGGAGACILALLPVENGAAALLLQGGLAALMVKTGFPVLNGKRLIGGIAWLYGLAFFLGGILEAVRVRVELPVTVSGLIAAILSSLLIRKRKETKVQRDNLFRVTLSFHGINKSLRGFRDTGNQLRDPYFGRPVAVVERRAIEEFLGQKAKILWIPYHSIGHEGAMAAFTPDYLLIERGCKVRKVEKPLVAVTRGRVSARGTYQMILPSELIDD